MNLSEFQWHLVEPEMQLRHGGPRGRLFARVAKSGTTWWAVMGLHLSPVRIEPFGVEGDAIEAVEEWLAALLTRVA